MIKQVITVCIFAMCSSPVYAMETTSTHSPDLPVWASPIHTNLEVYINQYVHNPWSGCIGHPDISSWKPNCKISQGFSCGDAGELQYTINIECKGSKSGFDHYHILISYPSEGHLVSFSKDIVYEGNDIELFKDSMYKIGIRPRPPLKNSEPVN